MKMENEIILQISEQFSDANSEPIISFQCDICNRVFAHPNNLNRHKKLHAGVKPFVCGVCDKTFNRYDSLKSHSLMHNEEDCSACTRCGKMFKSKTLLKSHLINKHGAKICLYELYQNKHSSRRKQPHKSLLCDICGASFVDDKRLKNHLKQQHSHDLYLCHLCNKTFKQQSAIHVHLKQHLGVDQFICEQCNKSFQSASSLKWHIKKHDRLIPSACHICLRMFADEHLLKMHLKIHDGEKMFKCPYCDKTFTHGSTLKHHVRLHTGHKPYKCDECGHAFAQLASLKYHKIMHTGAKPYSCHICGKAYTRNSTLSIHLTRHTGQKRIQCPQQCDFRCDTLKKLRKHLEQQHPELKDIIDVVLKQCKGRVSGALYADSSASQVPLILNVDSSAMEHTQGQEETYTFQQDQEMDNNVVFANLDGNASEKLYELTFSYMEPQDNNEVRTYEIVYPMQASEPEVEGQEGSANKSMTSQVYSHNPLSSEVIDASLDALKNLQGFPGESTVEVQIEEIEGTTHEYQNTQIVVIDIEPCEPSLNAGCEPASDGNNSNLMIPGAESKSEAVIQEGELAVMGYESNDDEIIVVDEEDQPYRRYNEHLSTQSFCNFEDKENVEVSEDSIEIDTEKAVTTIEKTEASEKGETIEKAETKEKVKIQEKMVIPLTPSLTMSLRDRKLLKRTFILKKGTRKKKDSTLDSKSDITAVKHEVTETELPKENKSKKLSILRNLPLDKSPKIKATKRTADSDNSSKSKREIKESQETKRKIVKSKTKKQYASNEGMENNKKKKDKHIVIESNEKKKEQRDLYESNTKMKEKSVLKESTIKIKDKNDRRERKKKKKEQTECIESNIKKKDSTDSKEMNKNSKDKSIKKKKDSNKKFKSKKVRGKKKQYLEKFNEDIEEDGILKIDFNECGDCGLTFSDPESLETHQCLLDGSPCYPCTICKRKFSRPEFLMLHQLTHKGTNSFLCSHCGSIFDSMDKLSAHITDKHDSMHPFLCSVCPFSCNHLKELKQHIKTHEVQETLVCEVCNMTLTNAKEYKSHMNSHEMKRPFKCSLCDKTFKVMSCLKLHEKKRHTGEYFFKCGICNKAFIAASKLERHMRVHSGILPYACEICGKMFIDSRLLKTHIVTHKDERPYSCNVCSLSFKHKSTLNAHSRRHTGTKPYSCPICKVSFAQLSSVAYHQRIHDGVKPYICHICGNSYTRNTTLNMHMSVHTGIKRLSCPYCPFKVNRQKGLRNHIEKEHKAKSETFTIEIPNPQDQFVSTILDYKQEIVGDELKSFNNYIAKEDKSVSTDLFTIVSYQPQDHLDVSRILDYKEEIVDENNVLPVAESNIELLPAEPIDEQQIIIMPCGQQQTSSLSVAESLLQLQQQTPKQEFLL
ncbi:zinc finger protein 729-like [Biomphalaria glabrata]|uniref:Zinc finger protein 729-like n=1 Tax=Biomphalaria glabrata TaxID=6526 RepID=A0A9W2Z7P2_BIOGL|nr:zinc finger protein 729-like [Biomphalaria glabrata]XP_055870986.1 zinc finger protein 729-like [Biomphalaria glabrata]XP_055870987.1 zinc finger protein 729-like [Biomphalaria glabrata]